MWCLLLNLFIFFEIDKTSTLATHLIHTNSQSLLVKRSLHVVFLVIFLLITLMVLIEYLVLSMLCLINVTIVSQYGVIQYYDLKSVQHPKLNVPSKKEK